MAQKTVANFQELKNAVEDSETQSILLSADISFSGGIKVPPAKQTLVIDGAGHTITDNNSSAYTDALYIPAAAGQTRVTLKNAVFSGRNYYGIICVYDDSANGDVITELDGVTYTGPQAIYNRYGTTIVKDSSFNIEKNGSSAASQEFCEANRIVFQGKVVINSQTTSNAVMWFPFAGAAFTVSENASLTINALQTYLVYSDSAAKPAFEFKQGSSTRIFVKNGLFYSSSASAHIASSLRVGEDALLYVSSEANNGVPLFKCAGDFVVKRGGSVFFIMPASGSSPIIYFSAVTKVSFEEPKNLLFYANGGKVFSFAAGTATLPNSVSITAKSVNSWLKTKTPFALAGGFDDIPSSAFGKSDGSAVAITQTLSRSAVVKTENNLASGDEGYPLNATDFDLTKITVFSAGDLPLDVNRITDISSAITGRTDAYAAVEFNADDKSGGGTADENGDFSVTVAEEFVVGETVTVRANKDFLTTSNTVVVEGSVTIT